MLVWEWNYIYKYCYIILYIFLKIILMFIIKCCISIIVLVKKIWWFELMYYFNEMWIDRCWNDGDIWLWL